MRPFLQVGLDDPEFRPTGFAVEKAYDQPKLAQVMYSCWLAEQRCGTSRSASCVCVTTVKMDIERYSNLPAFSNGDTA